MGLQTNVTRRGGSVYYLRVTLPASLLRARAVAGLPERREVWKSLRTKDAAEARRRGPLAREQMLTEFERQLELLLSHDRSSGPAPEQRKLRIPADAEIEQLVWQLIRSDLRDDEHVRDRQPPADRRQELRQRIAARELASHEGALDKPTSALQLAVASLDDEVELGRVSIRADMHAAEADVLKRELAIDALSGVAQAVIADKGWDIMPGTPQYIRLCNLLKSGRLQALRAFAARDEGDYLSDEANPTRRAPSEASVVPFTKARAKRGETRLELLDIYLREESAGLSSEEVEKKRHVTKIFSEHVGSNAPVRDIGRADFRAFKQALAHWPVTANNAKIFRGKTFKHIVEANKKIQMKSIAPSTVNNYISALGAFFTWLHSNGYHDEARVTHGMLVKVDKSKRVRRPYSDEELRKIFSLPLFIGAESADSVRQPGEVLIADWRFWVPLVCLYTGSRLGEVTQLRTADVHDHDGRLFLQITDEGDDMTVKTKDSVRVIPVHDDLLRLGFTKYVADRARADDARLWPELKLGRHGRFSEYASKWWRQHLIAAGIGGNAYRFRHTFTDALRDAGHLDAEISPLMGHSSDSMTHRYGQVPQVTLDRRVEMVNKIVYQMIASVPCRN